MPSVRATLRAARTLGFQGPLVAIGDHLEARRMELGLFQIEVTKSLGVCEKTLINWKKGRREIEIRHYPKILAFLGYDPFPTPKTLPERLLALRRVHGWTIRAAAKCAGVDEATWAGWEAGRNPARMHRPLLPELFADVRSQAETSAPALS